MNQMVILKNNTLLDKVTKVELVWNLRNYEERINPKLHMKNGTNSKNIHAALADLQLFYFVQKSNHNNNIPTCSYMYYKL